MIVVVVVVVVVAAFLSSSSSSSAGGGSCEPVVIPMCKTLGYEMTRVPNRFGHGSQARAGYEVQRFQMLAATGCSHDLKAFLCAVYAPECSSPPAVQRWSCRAVCESARKGCEDVMTGLFGWSWPDELQCWRFPDGQCSSNATIPVPPPPPPPTGPSSPLPPLVPSSPSADDRRWFACPPGTTAAANGTDHVCAAPPCDAFWDRHHRRAARSRVAACAALCAASCLLASLTFAVDARRFPYPERPVVFLSLCCLMACAAHLVGYAAGDGVACDRRNASIARGDGCRCAALFVASYYFAMASAAWWLVLAIAWFLSAGLQWGREAIEARARYFHLVAWTVPAAKTVAALLLGRVEGDVLTGLCSVAVWSDDTAARDMVLIPLAVHLALSTACWTATFVCLRRVRRALKRDGTLGTDEMDRLTVRLGALNVLYTVLAATHIALLVHERVNVGSWITGWNSELCRRHRDRATACAHQTDGQRNKPSPEVFVAKHVVSLLVGVTPSVWMWCSRKTVDSWKRFAARALDAVRGRA